MFQVYSSGHLLHDDSLDDYRLFDASLDLELGKTGSFEFTIYPNHPSFDSIEPMKSLVTVSRNYQTVYKGRVLKIKYGFYGEKQVSCEGDLAFLLDSMCPPHSYTGSFSGYLDYVLGMHNRLVDVDQQFFVGKVTVADFSPFTAKQEHEYKSAFDVLNGNMVARSGGYLHVRYESGNRYLDLLSYTADVSDVSGQTIEIGKNLLDISREVKGEGVFSAIVPLGAKLEGSDARLDIKTVNSGLPYVINADAVAFCGGTIYRQVIFDNITNAQTLKTTAESYLSDNYAGEASVEITAADMSGMDASIDSFWIGRWVRVENPHHFNGTQTFLIKKMVIDLLDPASNKIVIGEVKKGLSDAVAEISDAVGSIEEPEAVQPYVMDSGTKGIWTWKILSDNTCEFFGKIPISSADVTTAFGAWYRGAVLFEPTAYEYPVEMTEAPALEATFQTRNGLGAMAWVYSQDAETAQKYVPQCYLIRPSTATGIFGNINIIAKGKVKT